MPDTSPNRSKTDPATFEVVKNSLLKAAEEMKIVLAKTAYSPVLKVAGDYSCGIFDAKGDMVAQGPDLPIHLGSMPDAVRAVIQAFGNDIHDGDVFIHNDPYFGGSHLPDVNVVGPAFYEGRLLGFGCVRAHWPDIGSATPGSYGAVTEVYGEGLRLPRCAYTTKANSTGTSRRLYGRMSAHPTSVGATSVHKLLPTDGRASDCVRLGR